MGGSQSKYSPAPQAASLASENAEPPSVAPSIAASSGSAALQNSNTESQSKSSTTISGGGCPMKNSDGSYRIMPGFGSLFGKLGGSAHPPVDVSKINTTTTDGASNSNSVAAEQLSKSTSDDEEDTISRSSGCPVKPSQRSSWNILKRGGPGPGSAGASSATQQQYDVYSRPLPMDPTNNMPIINPQTIARNSLPAPNQNVALPTERVSSSIPKVTAAASSGDDSTTIETWTYPSPQMFFNALARKGKLDADTSEEDMISVVAIHNCMNEGTWGRILQWEKVLNHLPSEKDDKQSDGEVVNNNSTGGPSLTKFMGRPTDLSPKAAFKHYILQHPLPFDRHDWTVSRPQPDGSVQDVRYVIDYYHDDNAAKEEDGSGLPQMNEGIGSGGKIQSLLVDVRPAADGISEIWGRLVSMPLARRGCRSILECVLFKGHGSARDVSDFEPLPMIPSDSLKQSLSESQVVWENIQRDATMKKGVGAKDEACASDSLNDDNEKAKEDVTSAAKRGREAVDQGIEQNDEEEITKSDATKMASTFGQILSSCQESRKELQTCNSDEECQKAFMGMTICAGQYMCPLQHSSLLKAFENHGNDANEDVAVAKIDMAMNVLGECVSNYDGRASVAKKQYPAVFEKTLQKK